MNGDRGPISNIAVAVLAVVCMLPSIAINAIYLLSHGGELAVALSLAATLSVVLAGITPITFMNSLRAKSAMGLIISSFVFTICLAFNVSNAVGIAASTRAETVTARTTGSDTVERLKWQLGTARQSRDTLARDAGGKTATMIRAELSALQQKIEWASSRQCTDATIPTSRSFCVEYKSKEGLLDAAARVDDLDRQISDISAKLAITHAVAGQAADPQASAVNFALKFVGIKVADGDVGTGLVLLLALVVEAIGSFGAFVFMLLLNPAPAPRSNTAAVEVSAPAPSPRPKPKGAPRGAPKRGKGQKKAPTPGQAAGGATILSFERRISKDDAEKMLREAGTQRAAAEKLGISPRTLRRILTA
jgi:hypothetical protein